MSYDNNLDGCTQPITDGLRAGLVGDQAAVTILSDRPDNDGLLRLGFTSRGHTELRLPTDDITDPRVVVDYMNWAVSTYPAKHYAVVFLDHGGALDQMCADDHAGPRGERQGWLSARAMAAAMTDWTTKGLRAKVDLLFLQQCGRGSIENLYQFRKTAKHILASQTNVGACNTYYRAAVAKTADGSTLDGAALGKQIMSADFHYTDYVLVRGDALAQAPKVLASVAEELLAIPGERFFRPDSPGVQPCFEVGPQNELGEGNYDLISYVRAVYEANGLAKSAARVALMSWLEKSLVVEHRFQNQRTADALNGKWFGVSMHVPRTAGAFQRYARIPLYDGSSWGKLAARLAISKGAPKAPEAAK